MELNLFVFIFIIVFGIACKIAASMKNKERKRQAKEAKQSLRAYQSQFHELEKQLSGANTWQEEQRIQDELNRLQQQMIQDQNLINMGMDMQNFQNQQNLDQQMQQMNDFMNFSMDSVTPFEMGGMDMNQGNSFNDMNNCGGFNDFGGGGMGMF